MKSGENIIQSEGNQEEKRVIRYLIIGGAPKSATTSLFRYLADHPEICPANRKETYFFAREFDRKNVCKFSETLESFENYFSHCDSLNKLRVEATPYTLYSKGAAEKILTMLPNAVILFILRDPLERLFSDYRMHKQRGAAYVQNKTFEEYVETQFSTKGDLPNNLALGCYLEYLRSFLDTFGHNRVHILFFEEFKANPSAQMRKLCRALGINPEFYSSYRFNTHNQSINIRYSWLNRVRLELEPVVANLRVRVIHNPKIHQMFENIVSSGKFALHNLNNQESANKESISDEVRAYLVDYYRPHNQALSKELGRSLPWKFFQET